MSYTATNENQMPVKEMMVVMLIMMMFIGTEILVTQLVTSNN